MTGDRDKALSVFRRHLSYTPNPEFPDYFITAMRETGFTDISSMKPITCKDGAIDLLIK